jgi:nucleoside-diphosphate-sugar epimerase
MNASRDPDRRPVLVAGCGYVGTRLAALLADDGVPVFGLRREPSGLPPGVRPVAADVTDAASLTGLPPETGAVVFAVAPGAPTGDAYRAAYVEGLHNVLAAFPGPVDRLVLVSSTGVYSQTDGGWVDESTDPEATEETARAILDGERLALGGLARTGIVLRLGGIYGPGRTRLIRQVLDGVAPCMPEDVYGNRIHVDDAAGAIRHLLRLDRPEPLYLGVDRDPAPLRDVYAWIAHRAGGADPCREDRARATPPQASAAGRRRSNKRCSSRRLADSGFVFRYPTFREGYGALVDQMTVDGRGGARGL